MKTIGQLPAQYNKEVSASKPFGAIINETDTVDGTPVVREIYNDPLINIYKILELAGITPDGTEDGETNGPGSTPKYQLVEALQNLPNLLQGVEQVLSLTGAVWSAPLDLDILPNKYWFIARATDNYISGTFKGTGATTYPFTSNGFSASDELLVVVDQSGVRAYSLSSATGGGSSLMELFTVMGVPLAYNDNSILYYQEAGTLLNDVPNVQYIQNTIRTDIANSEALVTEMFIYQNYLLCVVFVPSTITYVFRQFALSDFSESDIVNVSGATIPTGVDRNPYFYFGDGFMYATNKNGETATNNEISTFQYSPNTQQLILSSIATINASFVKTSNVAVKQGKMYVLYNGNLKRHDLNTLAVLDLGTFTGVAGNLFNYLGNIYFTSGEVAKKWA